MIRLFRLLKILHTFARHRLDTLVTNEQLPWRYRLLLLPCRLYPTPKSTRGQRLRVAFEQLGPIFVKFGQLLSTRPDLIPDDIAKELSYLQDQVTPFDNTRFQQLVETALGDKLDHLFSAFSEQPLASASVAQVHTAKLPDNSDVIIKVIRPGIEKIITQDIALMTLLARTAEKILPDGKRLRPVDVVNDYKTTIFDELDLTKEAANASQLRRNFNQADNKYSDKLYVPEVYWPYTRKNVMVMERIYGIPVTDIKALKQQNTHLKSLAETGVNIFFTQVFDQNFFHADMHPGNVFVSFDDPQNPSYIAVDMAIVGSLSREDQYYLARNLIAIFRRDYRQVAELHVASGWVPPETSISGFEAAIRAVCEPIFEKPLKEISFGQALINLFKTAQRFDMPVQPQLVLLQKTLLNIEGLGRQLYPDLDLWATAHPFLEDWLKRRYSARTLWKQLQYHAPQWLEMAPQAPHLLLNGLQQAHVIGQQMPTLASAMDTFQQHARKKRQRKKLAALAIFASGIAGYLSGSLDVQLPREAWLAGSALIAAILLL